MRILLLLIKKDFKLLFNRPDDFLFSFFFSLMLSVLVYIGINISFIPQSELPKLYPVLVWIIFIFSASIVLGRSLDFEMEEKAIYSLQVFKVPSYLSYFSRVICNFFLILLTHILNSVVLSLLLKISISKIFLTYFLISALVVLAYSALASLLVAITNTSRLKGLLLPVILYPLLFPVFFAALEISLSLIQDSTLSSFWLSLLLLLNVIYLVLGFNLYSQAIDD